jgi:hypothetical protein
VWLLDEERAGPDKNVGADHVFHGIEDARVPDQVIEPGRMRIGVRAPFHIGFGDRTAKIGFEASDTGQAGRDFGRIECGNREQKTVVAIVVHLLLSECLHGCLSVQPFA